MEIINITNKLNVQDIYFSNIYGNACEYSDNACWECCKYKDLIYVYLKKPYEFENIIYYDLITPYGYSGYNYTHVETFDEFIILFRVKAKELNYLTEVIKQTPYFGIKLNKYYNVITSKKIFSVDLTKYSNFEACLKDTGKNNKCEYNYALKHGFKYLKEEYNYENIQKFLPIYNSTMDDLNSDNYYYFNIDYYHSLISFGDNIFFANIYSENKIVSSNIIFEYDNFLHYHLSGTLSEYRKFKLSNFLFSNVIKYGINSKKKMYHLGGGLKDNDSLSFFKNKHSNVNYDFIIYKNVLNDDVYDKIKSTLSKSSYFPIHRE